MSADSHSLMNCARTRKASGYGLTGILLLRVAYSFCRSSCLDLIPGDVARHEPVDHKQRKVRRRCEAAHHTEYSQPLDLDEHLPCIISASMVGSRSSLEKANTACSSEQKLEKAGFPVARHPGSRQAAGLAPWPLVLAQVLLQYGCLKPFSTNLGFLPQI